MDFWLALIGSSLAFGVLGRLIVAGRLKYFEPVSRQMTSYWTEIGTYNDNRLLCLLAGCGVALLCWVSFVSPALYESRDAYELLFKTATDRARSHKEIEPVTDLIVTATLLPRTTDVSTTDVVAPDAYFCFPRRGADDCKHVGQDARFRVETKRDAKSIVDPVFGSGSPFPIFPATPVTYRSEPLRVIDGGYAHNVPVEAARILGARQVVIVNSAPIEHSTYSASVGSILLSLCSGLVQNTPRLLPILFERSQQMDAESEKGLFVASVSPSSDGEDFPFLADYREPVMQRLRKIANTDIKNARRVGTVTSWGMPQLWRHIRVPATVGRP